MGGCRPAVLVRALSSAGASAVRGAARLDNDRQQGPLVSTIGRLLGMACGAMGCSLLLECAPAPTRWVYWRLVALLLAQAVYVWRLPETVSRIPGALASLRPTLHVPPQARRALWLALPVDLAVWAMGGFYLSLAPSLVRAATGSTSNLIGGGLVAVLTLSGALMIFSLRNHPPEKVLRLGAGFLVVGVALILAAVHTASLPLFFIATLIAGSGFGSGFLGALRSVVPLALPHERAGLMSAFYVLSYLAFCVPSLLAGNLARTFGLIATTNGYGAVLIMLALGALLALMVQGSAKGKATVV